MTTTLDKEDLSYSCHDKEITPLTSAIRRHLKRSDVFVRNNHIIQKIEDQEYKVGAIIYIKRAELNTKSLALSEIFRIFLLDLIERKPESIIQLEYSLNT